MKKGISLIALIITIIVIIILATSVIISLNNLNIIGNAEEARFKSTVKSYLSELELYKSDVMLEDKENIDINTSEDLPIENFVKSIKDEDKPNFIISSNDLYYVHSSKKQDRRFVEWAKEAGCKVVIDGEIFDSNFVNVNGTTCYSPELNGFNKRNLSYLVYENGKEKRIPALSSIPAEDWYDYSKENKKWANVVTANNNKEVYLVWIPRYAYRINNNTIDIVFTDLEDNYIDSEGNKKHIGNDYIKHSAFTLDFSDEGKGKKEIKGFWSSKYEVSAIKYDDFSLNEVSRNNENKTTLFEITEVKGTNLDKFKYFVNGKLVGENSTGKFILPDFKNASEYVIKVEAYDANGKFVGTKTKFVKVPGIPLYREANKPDLTGFNKDCTYYLTYDENGNEKRVSIKENEPFDWYDYSKENKKWANIVVSNKDKEIYLVWIPRYEYRIVEGGKIDIAFILPNELNPTSGYLIPDSFTLRMEEKNNINLSGFWASKYEISKVKFEDFNLNEVSRDKNKNTTKFEVSSVKGINLVKFKYYVNNEFVGENLTGKYLFNDFENGKKYTIKVEAYDSVEKIVGFKEKIVNVPLYPDYTVKANKPDLTGFNKECTYYLTYDKDGNEKRVSIKENEPVDWYDYSKEKKKWANIVVSNNNKEVYLVWIPRYQYRIVEGGKIDIAFVSSNEGKAIDGYLIPDSFTLRNDDGSVMANLSGFWGSKYEVSK